MVKRKRYLWMYLNAYETHFSVWYEGEKRSQQKQSKTVVKVTLHMSFA